MDKKKEPGQYYSAHKFVQTSRTWFCNAVRLPTVHAATLYKRVTPPEPIKSEEHVEKQEAKTLRTVEELNTSDDKETKNSGGRISKEELQCFTDEEKQMTGWERIKRAYTIDPENKYVTSETYDLLMMLTTSFALGFTYGGVPSLRFGKKRYIETSQAVAYETKFHAVSESYNAGARGMIRYGFRWGWRVAVVATSFQLISSCLSLYRYKVDMVNYGTAGGVAGAMYRCNLGLRGMIGGGVAGLVVGIPAGLSLLLMQRAAGEDTLQRAVRIRADYMLDFQRFIDTELEKNADALDDMRRWLEEKEKSEEAKR